MTDELKEGDLVQVYKTIVGGFCPVHVWVSSYLFISEDNGIVKVQETVGPFAGCIFKYDRNHVRKDL